MRPSSIGNGNGRRSSTSRSGLLLLVVVTLLGLTSSVAQAGFLDRLRGGPSGSGSGSAGSGSRVDPAAPPAPPSEPSLDPFGGSAGHATAVVQEPIQAGGPSVAHGQGAVKTQAAATATTAGSANTVPVQREESEEPFDGYEFRWKRMRIRPRELRGEAGSLTAILAFIGIALVGRKRNQDKAVAWWRANIDPLAEQFASFSAKPESASLTRADGATYLAHASGRRGVNALSVKISTAPNHDVPASIYYLANKIMDLTYVGSYNTISLDFSLPDIKDNNSSKPTPADDFVWGLIKKDVMQERRAGKNGFDLQAFTTVSEPNVQTYFGGNDEFVTMTEAGMLNDFFLKGEKVGFRELFSSQNVEGKKALKWLQSLIISDVVKERPEEDVVEKEGNIPKDRKLSLVMTLPPPSKAGETLPLVELALNIIDVLNGSTLSNDMANKAKRRRAEVHSLLLQESRKEAKEKSFLAQQAIKKRAEQERLEKMAPAERRKYEAKQKDKLMKKEALKQQKK